MEVGRAKLRTAAGVGGALLQKATAATSVAWHTNRGTSTTSKRNEDVFKPQQPEETNETTTTDPANDRQHAQAADHGADLARLSRPNRRTIADLSRC